MQCIDIFLEQGGELDELLQVTNNYLEKNKKFWVNNRAKLKNLLALATSPKEDRVKHVETLCSINILKHEREVFNTFVSNLKDDYTFSDWYAAYRTEIAIRVKNAELFDKLLNDWRVKVESFLSSFLIYGYNSSEYGYERQTLIKFLRQIRKMIDKGINALFNQALLDACEVMFFKMLKLIVPIFGGYDLNQVASLAGRYEESGKPKNFRPYMSLTSSIRVGKVANASTPKGDKGSKYRLPIVDEFKPQDKEELKALTNVNNKKSMMDKLPVNAASSSTLIVVKRKKSLQNNK